MDVLKASESKVEFNEIVELFLNQGFWIPEWVFEFNDNMLIRWRTMKNFNGYKTQTNYTVHSWKVNLDLHTHIINFGQILNVI